ncbi:efflux RND transporter periplasmic adaptor subunit [Cellulomonas hominis]
MGVTRRIVFPIIRIVIWAVIAVALVMIATDGTDVTGTGAAGLQPTAEIVEPTVTAETGTITNTVTLPASVTADPAQPVRATLAGTVTKVLVTTGQAVAADTPVLEIRSETPVDPTVTTDPETGMQTVTENRPKVRRATVTAGLAGTVTVTVLVDQVVSVGDTVGSVAPGTLSVTGTLTADQQYRLIGAPGEAQVTLKGGPAPFTCTGLRIGAAAPADAPGTDPAQATDATTPSGQVTCAIPPEVTAFAGLGADIAITNGTAEDAVLVPVTAVQGSVQSGNVWVPLPDGTSEQRAVTLGLNDGEHVQVVDGLAAGDELLEFIPVVDTDVDCADPAQYDPAVCG